MPTDKFVVFARGALVAQGMLEGKKERSKLADMVYVKMADEKMCHLSPGQLESFKAVKAARAAIEHDASVLGL